MKSDLFTPRAAFHLHTNFTDGKISVDDYFPIARELGIERLIFLEHIHRRPSYDVPEFIRSVQQESRQWNIPAHIGFETKILPDGELDISEENLVRAEVIGIAEHALPPEVDLLQASLETIARRYIARYPEITFVWVHPGLSLQRYNLLQAHANEFARIIQIAQQQGLLVERNLRYNLVSTELAATVDAGNLVTGFDAHHAEHFTRQWQSLSQRATQS